MMRKAIKQLGVLCPALEEAATFILPISIWTTMEIMQELMWKLPQKHAAGLA